MFDPDPPSPDRAPDWELMRRYAADRSQRAFAELVRRYVDFVYSTALRRTGGDRHLAEDVTQSVFLVLAQKAGTVRPGVILSGWLHNTTRYAAANVIKRETRRRRHERAAVAIGESAMNRVPAASEGRTDDWDAIAPLLESALDRLGATDRDAVLLRFIQGKSHRDVGQAMGISEDAARKRIERALSRLRDFFVARGVTVPAAAVGTLLATRAVESAPLALAASASAAGAGAGVASAGASLAHGALAMMTFARAKLIAACIAAVVVCSAATITITRALQPAAVPAAQLPPAPPAVPVMAQQPPPAAAGHKPIEAIVYGLDGEPLPGAEVFLCTSSRGLNAFTPDRRRNPPQITQADGKVSFPVPGEDFALFAVFHPDGFVQVAATEAARSPHLFLRPWARIEGVLLDGDTPLPGETIFVGAILSADDPVDRCITHQTTVKTDRAGKFILERIAPIGVHVYRQRSTPYMLASKRDFVQLEPGRVAMVQLGGIGRHVIGRLLPPEGAVAGLDAQWTWNDARARISSEVGARFLDVQSMPLPPGWDQLTPARQAELRRAWGKTPEGIEYRRRMYSEDYPIEPDGSFRFEDLRPGRYRLGATVRQRFPHRNFLETVATVDFEFQVPPLSPGKQRLPEPLDIGAIRIKPCPRLIVGAPAPDFVVQTLDGQPVTLADFKGKYLLIHLHYEHHRRDHWEALKRVFDSFAADPQFAMLTIHPLPRDDAEALRRNVERAGVKWPQAIASGGGRPGQKTKLDQAYQSGYGVSLIDPQGNVAAKLFRPEDAETEIAKIFLELR